MANAESGDESEEDTVAEQRDASSGLLGRRDDGTLHVARRFCVLAPALR